MVAILHKWLFVSLVAFYAGTNHPLFLSVTEVEHNPTANTVEISCKIFTDDFEKALRKVYNAKIDLLDTRFKPSMNVIVDDYIKKHLSIKVDGKPGALKFLGYEQQEEGIVSFYEIINIPAIRKLEISNDILYEYEKQQIGIIHATENGQRKSTKLNNPDAVAHFTFP